MNEKFLAVKNRVAAGVAAFVVSAGAMAAPAAPAFGQTEVDAIKADMLLYGGYAAVLIGTMIAVVWGLRALGIVQRRG